MIATEPEGVFIVLGDLDLTLATTITDASYGTNSLLQIDVPITGKAVI